MSGRFDTIVMVDWSGGNGHGPTPRKDAIWACVARGGAAEAPVYLRNRQVAELWLSELLASEGADGRRVLAGFDFPFGYPQGVAARVTGRADPFALWEWLEDRIEDSPKCNNRWQVAAEVNRLFPGVGPFWGNGTKTDIPDLPRKGRARTPGLVEEYRQVERAVKGTFSVWQLSGAGAVGSQVLMGLPVLARLRRRFGAKVWPFELCDGSIVFAEIWPSLINAAVKAHCEATGEFRDAAQVKLLARALSALSPGALAEMLAVRSEEEGWILGLGHEDRLRAAI